MFTLSVRRQDKNFFLSPITIALLRRGISILIISSIKTGGTFSPPAVIISSLIRPVTLKYPSASTLPMSPECNQSSLSMASLVFSGSNKYPIITFLLLMHISPSPFSSGSYILVTQPPTLPPTVINR
uniref:Uncharacterized protein n=1 Tax=Lepeophtheirus salmonis TaxID=72036 RepID=A0A0K2V695_LEPSM